MTLGGAGISVRIGDIAASTAAQTGSISAVTVDASGTLGTSAVASVAQLGTVQRSLASALAVSDAQFSQLSGRVGVVEGQINTLFDLAAHDRQQNRRGIAAAMAMAGADAFRARQDQLCGQGLGVPR